MYGLDPAGPPEARTRYADTSDGLSIAYQVLGQGPHQLVWVPGFASHVELFWELPGFAHAYRRLMRFCRLALFDKRGTGLSDRSLGAATLEDRVRDIDAVAAAAGFERFTLLGVSEGAAISVLYAASHPERVERLVLLGGNVTGDWFDDSLIEAIERTWGSGEMLRRYWLNGAGDLQQLSRIERAMGTPRAMADQMRQNTKLDARPVLEAVHAPTLVLHCVGDPVVPVRHGRFVAEHIDGARIVEVPGAFHGSNHPEEMDRYMDAVEAFVTGQVAVGGDVANRVLATVLLTDIVSSTDRAAAIGDDRWMALLGEHDRVARHAVERFEGRLVKSTGDGVLAVFTGPARAIEAAQTMVRNLQPLDIRLRAAVHTGELELRGADIHGIAVHLTSRILATAEPGEIRVSATVPGLVVGSGIEFEDRGEATLRGIPGSWQLWAVHQER
jgi:pimeloyl-ACP methyl ester carboxylesterase